MKYLIVALNSFPGAGAGNEAGSYEGIRVPWMGFADNIIKVSLMAL